MQPYTIHFDATLTVEVEAESEDRAIEMAKSIAEQYEEDFNGKWASSDASLSVTSWQNFAVVLPDGTEGQY